MNSPGTNFFLSSLSVSVRAGLLRHATLVELPLRTVLYEADAVPHYAHFLLSGLASIVTLMPNGESADVGFIGTEGVVGGLHLLGPALLASQCMMQLPGHALRLAFQELQTSFANNSEVRSRIEEFVQEQAAMVLQIAGCNCLHNAKQRLTRWLLMAQDHTQSDALAFTHEYLAELVGAQRSTVTLIAGELQERGLIRYRRGRIHILDRLGLETATCACYPVVKELYGGLHKVVPTN